MANPAIIISEQDLHRLETMLEHQPKLTPTMQLLEEELARADVVAPQDMPANVVSPHCANPIHPWDGSRVVHSETYALRPVPLYSWHCW